MLNLRVKKLIKHNITDGLVRESLAYRTPKEAKIDINTAIERRLIEINVLKDILLDLDEVIDMSCERKSCLSERVAKHFHRLDKTWYCEDCARKIQEYENTKPEPIEIFKEFYVKPCCDEKTVANFEEAA